MRLSDISAPHWGLRLTLTCLQGLVNRSAPRLWLVQDLCDDRWLEWLVERADVEEVTWLSAGEVLDRFLPVAESVVLADPALPASTNVATMPSSVNNWIVATPACARTHRLREGRRPALRCST